MFNKIFSKFVSYNMIKIITSCYEVEYFEYTRYFKVYKFHPAFQKDYMQCKAKIKEIKYGSSSPIFISLVVNMRILYHAE